MKKKVKNIGGENVQQMSGEAKKRKNFNVCVLAATLVAY